MTLASYQMTDSTFTVLGVIVIFSTLFSYTTVIPGCSGLQQSVTSTTVQGSEYFSEKFIIDCDGSLLVMHKKSDHLEFEQKCTNSRRIRLVSPAILPTSGMTVQMFHSFINAPELEMCIRVQMTPVTFLDFNHIRNLTGLCKGPSLVITQNDLLERIEFNEDFMKNAQVSNVLIRGNAKLNQLNIQVMKRKFPWYAIDLQDEEECGIPYPFVSYSVLNDCTNAYGVMAVRKASQIPRRTVKTTLYLSGCLIIHSTDLRNIDFLEDVTFFHYIENMCPYGIIGNDKLCIKNLKRLRDRFKHLNIDQSSTPNCVTVCDGGVVTEDYLDAMEDCETIDGNLKFTKIGFSKDRPASMSNLNSIVHIIGSIYIYGTSTMGDFDELENLETIAVPEDRHGSAIKIIGNKNLRSISLPNLQMVNSSNDVRIVIVDNPQLTMDTSTLKDMYRVADGEAHTLIVFGDEFTVYGLSFVNVVLLLVLLLIAVICSSAILMVIARRREGLNEYGFPKPPWGLDPKSMEILADWVKVIVTKNPLVWRCSDRELIWLYGKSDGTHKDIEVLVANNDEFLKKYMLSLAPNGRITIKEKYLVFERIKSMLSKSVVIMIGSERRPSCVLPSIPVEVNQEHTYKYISKTYSFTLNESKKMAPTTTKYVYKVVIIVKNEQPKTQIVTVYYLRWDKKRMPQEYDEVLQVAMACQPQQTICVSDRRKEVFSLLYMFFTYCYIMKESIDFLDALQLHTETCNGNILDRDELLYVMAVIMEWAYQSDSLTPELKWSHMEWCHSYAIMAKFMRNNTNIKLVHPDYLKKLDLITKQNLIKESFTSSPRFSDRDSKAFMDPFRRRVISVSTQSDSTEDVKNKESKKESNTESQRKSRKKGFKDFNKESKAESKKKEFKESNMESKAESKAESNAESKNKESKDSNIESHAESKNKDSRESKRSSKKKENIREFLKKKKDKLAEEDKLWVCNEVKT